MSDKMYRLSFIVSALFFAVAFSLFYYTDLQSLTIWTTNVWDTIASCGNLREYYAYSAQNLYDLDHVMVDSDILIYIPWAVWNLPIWLLQKHFDMPIVEHAGMLFYSKCFLLLVFALILYLADQIAKQLIPDTSDRKKILFLSSTSFFVLTAIAYIGQNDVFVIAPFLAGVLALLKGQKRRFLLWAALSIAFKPFMAFSLIALLLLYEKNLLKIMAGAVCGFSLYFGQKLLFMGAPSYAESLEYGPMQGAVTLLFQYVLGIPRNGASFFMLGLGVVYILAYFTVIREEKKFQYTIYFATAPLIMLFIFTQYEFYRPIYLVPLLYILFMTKPAYYRTNLILDMVSTVSLIIYYLFSEPLFYHPGYIPGKDISIYTIPSIYLHAVPYVENYYFYIPGALFMLGMIMMLVINHPSFESKNEVLTRKEESWLILFRSLIYAIPLLISVKIRF